MGGQANYGGMNASIYGLTMSLTNQLSTLGQIIPEARRNFVTVAAGDSVNGQSSIYTGIIYFGWADYASMPNNAFRIQSPIGGYPALLPIPPTTIKGSADVATIMSGLAVQAGHNFENNGVNQQLFDPYFPGSAGEQIKRVAEKANIDHVIDPVTNTLAIWPLGSHRGDSIPLISPDTGMIGYPTFGEGGAGIEVTTVFNPAIRYGSLIQVQSSLPQASQKWGVIQLVHELESMVPGGAWRSKFICKYPNQVAT
jgi:hypothetical protein